MGHSGEKVIMENGPFSGMRVCDHNCYSVFSATTCFDV